MTPARLAEYRKTATAVVALGITYATAFYGSTNKWVVIAIAVAGALGVYAVPNEPHTTKLSPAAVPTFVVPPTGYAFNTEAPAPNDARPFPGTPIVSTPRTPEPLPDVQPPSPV